MSYVEPTASAVHAMLKIYIWTPTPTFTTQRIMIYAFTNVFTDYMHGEGE